MKRILRTLLLLSLSMIVSITNFDTFARDYNSRGRQTHNTTTTKSRSTTRSTTSTRTQNGSTGTRTTTTKTTRTTGTRQSGNIISKTKRPGNNTNTNVGTQTGNSGSNSRPGNSGKSLNQGTSNQSGHNTGSGLNQGNNNRPGNTGNNTGNNNGGNWNQGNNNRPNNNGNNGGNWNQGNNNRPNNNNGGNWNQGNNRPNNNGNNGGNFGNNRNHQNGYHYSTPRSTHQSWSDLHWGHPSRPWCPPATTFHRPVAPSGTYVYYSGFPTINTILGVALGTAINVGINALLNSGYTITGYVNDAVYLSNVPQLNYYWPDATMYFENGVLSASEFFYSTSFYNMDRYNSVYNRLLSIYGTPYSVVPYGSTGASATWWGANGQFITLNFAPGYASDGSYRYFTTLSFGN